MATPASAAHIVNGAASIGNASSAASPVVAKALHFTQTQGTTPERSFVSAEQMTALQSTDATLVDEYASDFTYSFLKGIDTLSPNRPRKIKIPKADLDKMGNMERQYWDIKKEHFDVVVFFKKGKFYELYDCDAVLSAREFNLKLTADTTNRGKMRMTGVPEQTFSSWARLFVFKGYKIGRVEQMEVEEGAKVKVVPRHLVQILTKGTVSDAAMLTENDAYFVVALAVSPDAEGQEGNAMKIDAVAIDVTRNVFLHCPCTGSKREEVLNGVASLLMHLQPKEVLLDHVETYGTDATPPALYTDLKGVVTSYAATSAAGDSTGTDVSVEYIDQQTHTALKLEGASPINTALRTLQSYFQYLKLTSFDLTTVGTTQPSQGSSSQLHARTYTDHLSKVSNAASQVATASGNEVSLMERESRQISAGLVLDAATIENLELITNLKDGSTKDTVLQRLNQCCSGGGKRMFRKWLLRPLNCPVLIGARQDAIRTILNQNLLEFWKGGAFNEDGSGSPFSQTQTLESQASTTEGLKRMRVNDDTEEAEASSPVRRRSTKKGSQLLKKLFSVDLERNLASLSAIENEDSKIAYIDPLVVYAKNLATILDTIDAFEEGILWAKSVKNALGHHESQGHQQPEGSRLLHELLDTLINSEAALSSIKDMFDKEKAVREQKVIPKPGFVPAYDAAVDTVTTLKQKFDDNLATYKKKYFANDKKVQFAEIGKDLFLVEVPPGYASIVKDSLPHLHERNATQKSIKYTDTSISSEIETYKKAQTARDNALVGVLRTLAKEFGQHFATFFTAAQAFSYVDCLMNLSKAAAMPGMCCPKISSDATLASSAVEATNMIHPMLQNRSGVQSDLPPVANNISLTEKDGKVLLLTGPNMAGKSTLMRTVAIGVLMAQMGGYVCADSFSIANPVDRIFTRIGARDVTHRGMSTLFVELTECSAICAHATSNSLCLVDELGRGTSTHDGYAIAHATLQHLTGRLSCAVADGADTTSTHTHTAAPLVVFSTHYHSLAHAVANDAKKQEGIQLGYMDFAITSNTAPSPVAADVEGAEQQSAAAGSSIDSITFLYKLVPGICSRSYGVEVAVKAGVKVSIVEEAQRRSAQLATSTMHHLLSGFVRKFVADTTTNDQEARERLAADCAALLSSAAAHQ